MFANSDESCASTLRETFLTDVLFTTITNVELIVALQFSWELHEGSGSLNESLVYNEKEAFVAKISRVAEANEYTPNK
jgi:hypothetical protein